MTETLWHDRLSELAEVDDASTFDVGADLQRARTRLRARRVAQLGAGTLVAAVLVGGSLVLGGSSGPGPAVAPAGPPTPTFQEPVTTFAPSPEATPSVARSWLERQLYDGSARAGSPFPRWRQRLFETTRSVLDPRGGHLDYSTQSFHGGGDGNGGFDLGIKMGWREPGHPGEGMVQLQVNTQQDSDQDACSVTAGFGCRRTVLVGGATMKVGESGSSYVVLHRQPDGDRIVVLVDAVFGNNTTTAVRHLGFTKGDVYRLVQDDRIDLPAP